MSVFFESRDKNFQVHDELKLRKWIEDTIKKEGKVRGNINIQFVRKSDIEKVNSKFLNHNYPTDIIAFNKSFLKTISGDVYICIEIVRKNSLLYSGNSFKNELNRVIIHGILHLIGYNDIRELDKNIMRKKEDLYLSNLEGF